jgi:probable rRNA maturation factor
MNVKVELENDCPDHWVPPLDDMEKWLSAAGDRLADGPASASVSVRVVDEAESASLNSRYRDKNQPTNVLSFACELPDAVGELLDTVPLGDLAVCAPLVDSEAKQQGKTLESHWAHLLTHGFLHLNGFRHNTDSDAEAMETAEIAILNSLGFSNPYVAN